MFVFKDISLLKELEKNKATQKITKMSYYQVTHELLTPINTIQAMLELIKLYISEYAQEVTDYLNICQTSLSNMLHIITHYLDSQKLDEGMVKPIP